MKYIILVGDGMGDYPIAELANKTPLQAAHTPTMDFIADHGEMYCLKTVPDGHAPGSDVANLSLVGYCPEEFYTGRSPLEAASMGVTLAEGEVAFRCNFVTLDRSPSGPILMRDYSAGHISTPEASELIKALAVELNDDIFTFYPGISYRHLLVRKGEVSGLQTVPPHDHIGKDVDPYVEKYRDIQGMYTLLERASRILENHEINTERIAQGLNPANAIWLWGEGQSPSMPTLKEGFGVTGALVSAVDLLKGIGVYAGMEVIDVPGATGYLDTNYQGKVDAAVEAMARHDLVLVHVEAPDETSHQGSLVNKMKAIEDFDKKIVKPILAAVEKYDFRLVVTADHYTPIELRTHVADPVPVALFDSRHASAVDARGYSEESAKKTGILINNGREFMNTLLERGKDGTTN